MVEALATIAASIAVLMLVWRTADNWMRAARESPRTEGHDPLMAVIEPMVLALLRPETLTPAGLQHRRQALQSFALLIFLILLISLLAWLFL